MRFVVATLIVFFSTCLFTVLSKPLQQVRPLTDLLLNNNVTNDKLQKDGLDSITSEDSKSKEIKLNRRDNSVKEKNDKTEKNKDKHQSHGSNDQDLEKLKENYKYDQYCKGCFDSLFDPRSDNDRNLGRGGGEF